MELNDEARGQPAHAPAEQRLEGRDDRLLTPRERAHVGAREERLAVELGRTRGRQGQRRVGGHERLVQVAPAQRQKRLQDENFCLQGRFWVPEQRVG